MRWVAVIVVALTGCLQSSSVVCSNGDVCPSGTICDLSHDLCIVQGQLDACVGVAQDMRCEFAGTPGLCDLGVCISSVCGDGRVGPGEVCDDGNLDSDDQCRGDCRSDNTCGNGVFDPLAGEECDCGAMSMVAEPPAGCTTLNSTSSALADCRDDCKLRCGDGIVQDGELCDGSPPTNRTCLDFGFDIGLVSCTLVCSPQFAGCGQFGWVPVHPGIDGAFLYSVWGSASDDVFAVGNFGLIVHWDGMKWTPMTSNTSAHLRGVWGFSATDVFAVGLGGTIMHYDGATWAPMVSGVPTSMTLSAVQGDPATGRVFAVGGYSPFAAGYVLEYFGGSWTATSVSGSRQFNAVAINNGIVTIVGYIGAVYQRTVIGTTWNPITGVSDNLFSAFATANDIYVGGIGGLYRATSVGGTFAKLSGTFGEVRAIGGFGPNAVFVLGNRAYYFDGTAWYQASEEFVLNSGIWGTNVANLWSVGNGIRHFAGTTWSAADTGVVENLVSIASGPLGVFAVAPGPKIVRFLDGTWVQPTLPGTTSFPTAVSVGADIVVVVSASSGDVLFSKSGTAFTQTTVSQALTPPDFRDVWAIDETRVFGVTNLGAVWTGSVPGNWDAMAFQSVTASQLNTIWGTSETNIFAAGNSGAMFRWTGTSWAPSPTGVPNALYDIWGSGPNDVFAVGTVGTILHFDGTSWTKMTSNTSSLLEAVWGTGPNDVFATGGDTLLHYDGTTWAPMRDSTTEYMRAIAGSGNRVHIVGGSGANELLLRLVP